MAFGNQTFADIGGAVSDLLSSQATAAGLRLKAQGDIVEGQNYTLAAGLADQNAAFTAQSTQIKQVMADRAIYQGIGTETSDIAGSGLSLNSGNAIDLLRDSASQGALQKGLIGEQGQITEAGYQEQATSYRNLATYSASAADTENSMAGQAETSGGINAGIKGAAAIATLFLK